VRLLERLGCPFQVPLGDAYVADLVERGRAAKQFGIAQGRLRHRGEVAHRLGPHVVENLEAPHGFKLGSQVSEHEADEIFGLNTPSIRFVTGRHRGGSLACQVGGVFCEPSRASPALSYPILAKTTIVAV
jgi:hypothetical protein